MEKILKNKTLIYVLCGLLFALQLTNSIINWCNGGFTGASLVLCILMLGLITIVGIGVNKGKNTLILIAGIAILSVAIYIKTTQCSGLIISAIQGNLTPVLTICISLTAIATFLLIGSLVLAILKGFGLKKDLRKLNAIFAIIATICFLAALLISIVDGAFLAVLPSALFSVFFPLLVAALGYNIKIKE